MFQATAEQRALVEELSTSGIPQSVICRYVEGERGHISEKTLRKHFAEELHRGTTLASVRVAGALFKQAMDGNVTAQIFWLKARARWTDKPREVQMTGAAGRVLPATPPALAISFERTADPS